jgi:acyl-CoA synthetase (AMP-forming)/AMP-acid ligase II
MNLFNLLAAAAARHGARGAVYHGTRQALSWASLADRALRLGGAITERAAPGSRIMILATNCPEYVELLFATWAAGCVAVPVNAKLHPREIEALATDAEPALVFASSALASALGGTVNAPVVRIGSAEYAALDGAPAAPAEVADNDLAWLFYTSGTTGRSKGAMLSHGNLRAMQIAHLADFEVLGSDDSLIHAAPMSHGSGLYILPYVARGARQVIPVSEQFNPDEVLALCDAHPGCGLFLAPTMVRRLRLAAEAPGGRPSGLRSIIYGGGPMYLEEIGAALACFGPVLTQLYGQGEAPMTITGLTRDAHMLDDPRFLGSVGWPRSGVEVRIAGPDGTALPFGEIGEILCRGAVVMRGYWRDAPASAAALEGGWLRTGDLGRMDADGLVTLAGRSKDLIISGGSNIYPREIEEVLLTHSDVVEVSVFGVPDPDWGEIVVAFVVAAPGGTADPETLDALCLARLARFKRPKSYHFVEALPKNAYGKVLKPVPAGR